ncbi:hypothetical protein D3C72_2145630 [compost metagenome]
MSPVSGLLGKLASDIGLSALRPTGICPSPRKLSVSQTRAMPFISSGCRSSATMGADRNTRSNIIRSLIPA